MTEPPRVWWSPSRDAVIADASFCAEHRNWGLVVPPDAIPLVPRVSREELREQVYKAIRQDDNGSWTYEMAADHVLDVLERRGVAQ